jgi:hypothetical protein
MTPTTDRQLEAIREALAVFLRPGQVTELRALGVGSARAVTAFFRDPDALARRAAELDAQGARGVYFVPNPLRPDLVPEGDPSGKGSARKADVVARHWLLIDSDPVRFSPDGVPLEDQAVPSTEPEREAAWNVLDRCKGTLDAAGLRGAVVGDSGNGWHLCYPVDLPADDQTQEQVKALLKGLQKRCGDPTAKVDGSTHDAPRIWKLYGTTARKGPDTPDRPHRVARLIEGSAPTAELAAANNALLSRLLGLWTRQDELRNPSRSPFSGREAVIARAKLYLTREPPAISGQGGHNQCFHAACILVHGFALSEEEAFEAIQDWNRTCRPPWSAAELRHKLADAVKQPGPRGRLLNETGPNGAARQTFSEQTVPPGEGSARHPDEVATIEDLEKAGSQVTWLWEGWIPSGVLTAVAALGGTGKTRFCADLLRRVRHGLPWPDGKPMTLPPDALALWVVSDNHHDEMVTLSRTFGIAESVRINAWKQDPYAGVTLETAEDLADLDARIRAVKPALVIIDTVGNSTDRNLSKQEEAKLYYFPLQVLARRHRCAILCLTHLNAGGGFLGRRVLEKVRVAIRMEQPDPATEKRRLEIAKSNSKKPVALGLTMTDHGNEYDADPPHRPEEAAKPHPRLVECCDWLREQLRLGSKRVSHVRKQAETAGFSSKTLYKARDTIGAHEFEAEGKKWWQLTTTSEDV